MKKISLYVMAILYMLAGVNHFRVPETYNTIMPPWLPLPYTLIYITGVLEFILGLLLLFRPYRNVAAWGLVVLLVLIFPANIQMMINYKKASNPYLWIAIARLPLQPLLIWWAYSYTDRAQKNGRTI